MSLRYQETFFIENSLANLAEARLKIKMFFSSVISSLQLLQVIQSVDEALTNIIEHSLNSRPEEKIKIDMRVFDNQIQIVITDPGPTFNPLKYPEVAPEKNYEAGLDGGIGIHIFRNFMHATYEPLQPQGNRLILTKEIR